MMERTTAIQGHLGDSIHRHPRSVLAAILMAVCLQVTAPACASETGIRGTVVWGPISPGPTSPGQSDEAPLSASFTVYGVDHKVARFVSDDHGHFEVSLPPGDYTVVPNKNTPVPNAERQKTQVTVPDDGFAVVTIRLDTGMK